MTNDQSAKWQGKLSGISKAALKGAKAREQGDELKEENASTMARPQPRATDPRSDPPSRTVDPSAAAHSSSSDMTSVGGQGQHDEDQP